MAPKETRITKPITLTLALFLLVAIGTKSATADDELTGWKDYSHFAQYQTGGVAASTSGSKLSFEGQGSTGRYTFADNQQEYALSGDMKIMFELELKAKSLTKDGSVNKTRAGISVLLAKRSDPAELQIKDGVEIQFFQEAPKASNRHVAVVEYTNSVPTSLSKRSISKGRVTVEIHYKSKNDKLTVYVDGKVLGQYKGLDELSGNKWVSPWFNGWQTGANNWDDIFVKNVKIESSESRPIGGEVTTRQAVYQKTGPEKVTWFGNAIAFVEASAPFVFDRMIVGGPKFSNGFTGPQLIRRQGMARFLEYDGTQLFEVTGLDVPCINELNPLPQLSAAKFGWSVADAEGFGQAAGSDEPRFIAIGAPGWDSNRGGIFIFDQTGEGLFCLEGSDFAGDAPTRFGWSIHCPGDINGDNIADLVVGAPTEDTPNGENAGKIYVFSGDFTFDPETNPNPDVETLYEHSGGSPGAMMGYSVGHCTTNTSDPKVMAGAPYEIVGNKPQAGAVYVFDYDIATQSSTRILKLSGENRDDYFGFSIADAGDFDRDGEGDIIIGAPNMNDSKGGAYVYRVSDGQELFKAKGHQSGGNMGWAVAGNIDLQGDGFSDIAISTPGSNDTYNRQGAATVYLGTSGALLTTIHGRHKKDELGSSLEMTTNSPYGDGALAAGTYRYLRNNKTGAAYLNILNQ